MKKWTVVIELTDTQIELEEQFEKNQIEWQVSNALRNRMHAFLKFQVMETVQAPYGPQHPDGVFIAEVKPIHSVHGCNKDCPDVQYGRATHCPGHDTPTGTFLADSGRKGNFRQ